MRKLSASKLSGRRHSRRRRQQPAYAVCDAYMSHILIDYKAYTTITIDRDFFFLAASISTQPMCLCVKQKRDRFFKISVKYLMFHSP